MTELGGYGAARLAIRRPEQVRALVLVNTAGLATLTPFGRAFARGVPAVARRLFPRLVRGYVKPRNEIDGAIAERVIAAARTRAGATTAATIWKGFTWPEYDLRDVAGRIEAPTRLVWGAKDTILPLKVGRETHELIPGSRLEVLDTGHVVFASEPDSFLALVEPLIESVTRASTRAVA